MMEYLTSSELFIALSLKFDFLAKSINNYLSVNDNLKAVSLVLMVLALILFLFLIIIIYIRNIIYFVKSNNSSSGLTEEESQKADDLLEIFDSDDQLELENELQKEFDMAMAEKQYQEELAQKQEELARQDAEKQKQKQELKKIEEEKKKEKEKKSKNKSSSQNKITVDLDWKKGKIPPSELSELPDINEISLSYRQNRLVLKDLIGLMIDMVSRGVDDLKIAQTINYKTQSSYEESEILKLLDSVKMFISMCAQGKFNNIKDENTPPQDLALFHLAKGDTSLSLVLLEKLMNIKIDKASGNISEDKKKRLFSEVSDYACCFGSLAEIDDIMLATSSYELAVDLNSNNVLAWSCLGDVYKKTNSASKTMWAFQNVINYADEEIDIAQIANANRQMSEQLYAQGNSLEAAKLYNSSKQYYDSLGINRRLDKQELEIIDIIERSHENSLPKIIENILSNSNEK